MQVGVFFFFLNNGTSSWGPRGPSPFPYKNRCWHCPPPSGCLPAGWEVGAKRGGEMSRAKRRFVLTSSAETMFCATEGKLDISQSQMSTSANTAGQL